MLPESSRPLASSEDPVSGHVIRLLRNVTLSACMSRRSYNIEHLLARALPNVVSALPRSAVRAKFIDLKTGVRTVPFHWLNLLNYRGLHGVKLQRRDLLLSSYSGRLLEPNLSEVLAARCHGQGQISTQSSETWTRLPQNIHLLMA